MGGNPPMAHAKTPLAWPLQIAASHRGEMFGHIVCSWYWQRLWDYSLPAQWLLRCPIGMIGPNKITRHLGIKENTTQQGIYTVLAAAKCDAAVQTFEQLFVVTILFASCRIMIQLRDQRWKLDSANGMSRERQGCGECRGSGFFIDSFRRAKVHKNIENRWRVWWSFCTLNPDSTT